MRRRPAPWRATALTVVCALLAAAGQTYRWYATQAIWPDPGGQDGTIARCSGAAMQSLGGSIPPDFHPVAVIHCSWQLQRTAQQYETVLTEQQGTGDVAAVVAAFGQRRFGHPYRCGVCSSHRETYLFINSAGQAIIAIQPYVRGTTVSVRSQKALDALNWTPPRPATSEAGTN